MNPLIQDLYQRNKKFKDYVDHWAVKHNVSVNEVLEYKITALVAKQCLNERSNNEKEVHIEFQVRQDNGID